MYVSVFCAAISREKGGRGKKLYRRAAIVIVIIIVIVLDTRSNVEHGASDDIGLGVTLPAIANK